MKKFVMNYKTSGVDYGRIDPFKRLAQGWAKRTSHGTVTRGESAYVWEEDDCYRAMVIEGLGTKNLVADAMLEITGKTYYDAIAQDTVAMIVNDLITVGASPQVINAYFAVGDSRWFSDKKRASDLVHGWAKACVLSGAVWGGGETPILRDVIYPNSIDLAGSAVGIIKPKERMLSGNRIAEGDAIVLIESNGIHANGLTLARAIADKLPDRYAHRLQNGKLFGEELLKPTHIYAQFVEKLFQSGIDLHYIVNITGHGWRKLMRPTQYFSYVIETIPPVPDLFQFIQQQGNLSDREMYATFNMGAGIALYLPVSKVPDTIKIAHRCKFHAWKVGYIKSGSEKEVILSDKITFFHDSLRIR